MKLNKNEKTGANTIELEFAIPADEFNQEISKVYRKEVKKYNVPGFRKGRAPRNLIERMFGADVFYSDAINNIFPDCYEATVKELELDPVSSPNAELVSASPEDGAVLKVTVTVKPEVKVGDYKGLKATKTVRKVEDSVVDAEMDRLRQRQARVLTREGKAEDGDIANIDYEGFVGDVAFDGGKGEGQDLTLGSGQFIPGFEEQVVGHKAGDEFDVKVTFPTEYHAEDLAGKEAVFKTKLNKVQYKELPELDDDFATEVSEYDTLDELKDSVRKERQDELDKQADLDTENQLVEQVVDTIEGEIPDAMYENRMDELVQDFAFRLQQQGLNLETYLQYTGMDMKAFRDGFKEQAEKQVKMRLALEAVVKMEGIEATEEDLDKEVARIAEQYKMEEEKVREIMPLDEVRKDLAVNKAIDLIKENAKITEKEPEPEKEADEKEGK